MINVIVPILEKVEEYQEFIKEQLGSDVKFFVGITENLKDKFVLKDKKVQVRVFKNKSDAEEIINSLHSSKLEKGKILIARRPLQNDEFQKLTKSTKDLAVLKASHSGFFNAIKRFLSGIVRRIFAFSFFEDISALCFGEDMFEIVSVCRNLSLASRINKFIGISTEEIITTRKPAKKSYKKFRTYAIFAFWSLLLAGSVAGGVCILMFTKIRVLLVVLVVCLIFVAFMFFLMGLLNFCRTLLVGQLHFGRAEEVI